MKNREKVEEKWGVSEFSGNQIVRVRRNDGRYWPGTFFIVVESDEFAVFTVLARTEGKPVSIIDGWPVYYSLVTDLDDEVIFTFLTSSPQAYCLVKSFSPVKPWGACKAQSNQTIPEYPLKDQDHSWDPSQFNPLEQGLNKSSYYSFKINMPSDKNLLTIGINLVNISESTSLSSPSSFSLLCSSSSQPSLLIDSSSSIGFLSKSTQSARYELLAPSKGRLTVKLIPCTGEFILDLSSLWNQASSESPDFFTSTTTNGVLYGFVNNAEGSYFLTISTKKEILYENVNFEYRLLTFFTPAGESFPKVYVPGGEGLVSWNRVKGSGVSLQWKPVEDQDGKKEGFQVEYIVYFLDFKQFNKLTSQEPSLAMQSACPYQSGLIKDSYSCQITGENNAICKKLPKDKGFVVVIGFVNGSIWDSVVYDITEVSVEFLEIVGYRNLLGFWIVVVLFLITVLLAMFFWRRSKLKDTILNYEMSDISNAGTVKKFGLDQKDNYSSFN
jgi:hypothetical protein